MHHTLGGNSIEFSCLILGHYYLCIDEPLNSKHFHLYWPLNKIFLTAVSDPVNTQSHLQMKFNASYIPHTYESTQCDNNLDGTET